MKTKEQIPTTLIEAVAFFADERKAWRCVVNRRWADGNVICPRCQSNKVHLIESRMIWRCNGCSRQFSVKVGTIFEDSPIPFSKWLPAMWLITNNKNGVSSCELARALGVTQKTAWFMLHRIRLAMKETATLRFGGIIEADETYIGGKARNMHFQKRTAIDRRGGAQGKSIVLGMMERGGMVTTKIIPKVSKAWVQAEVRRHAIWGSTVHTDEQRAYKELKLGYLHQFIDHTKTYVDGLIHTNSMENYWSLLKRTINGTYVSVEPFQLVRYLDEQAFRFNERKQTDAQRFAKALTQATGRRLTYNELIGIQQPASA